jgi:hypothetical protein
MDHTAAGGISASRGRRPRICCADRRPQRSQSRRSCAWTASVTRRSTAAAAAWTGTAFTAETATPPATRRSGMYERLAALCICLRPDRSRTVSFSIRHVVTYLPLTLSKCRHEDFRVLSLRVHYRMRMKSMDEWRRSGYGTTRAVFFCGWCRTDSSRVSTARSSGQATHCDVGRTRTGSLSAIRVFELCRNSQRRFQPDEG